MNEGILCRSLRRSFGEDSPLRDVNLELPRKGLFGITGSSGSGKSTLLNIFAFLDTGFGGDLLVFGRNPKMMSEEERCRFRLTETGYVFQAFNLLELETVEFNLLLPLSTAFRVKKSVRKAKIEDALGLVDLAGYEKRRVNTLSGGEKQRIALARALINDPRLLLLDEPTGALDRENAELVFRILSKVSRKALVVVVSHDQKLLNRYCDGVFGLEEGRFVSFKANSIPSAPAKALPNRMPGRTREWPHLPAPLLLRHAAHILKEKKWRSFFSEASISIGMIGVGLTLFLSFSISSQIKDAFSRIVPQNQIVMTSKKDLGEAVSNVYSATEQEADLVSRSFPDAILGYGCSYVANFEEWFADDNSLIASFGSRQIELPSFSIRSFNDCQWLEKADEEAFYPRAPKEMAFDQIVLGLPYPDMFQLCLQLRIERSFESLGAFLDDTPLPLVLRASRVEWGFQDEEAFELIAVAPTAKPVVYHRDHLWARKLFVDRMRFIPWREGDTPSPQSIYEVPYVEPRGDPAAFLRAIRKDEAFNGFLFQKSSPFFLGSLLEKGGSNPYSRLYVFSCDLLGPSWKDLDEVFESDPRLIGRDVLSSGGIFASPESLVSGFWGHLVFSPSEEDIGATVDAYSRLLLSQKDYPLELPLSCKDVGILQANSPLKMAFGQKKVDKGNPPESYEEMAVSSALYSFWGEPEEVCVAVEVSGEENGEYYNRDFSVARIKISGVVNGDDPAIYLPDDWSADFLFLVSGVDPVSLCPSGALFQIDPAADVKSVCIDLEERFPAFRFGSPALTVSEAVEDTLGYIREVLLFFALLSLAMSFLLSAISLGLAISENAKEGKLLFAMGANRGDVRRAYLCHGLLFVGSSFFSACLSLAVLQFGVAFYLSFAFRTSFRLTFSWVPLAGASFCSLLFVLAFSLLIYLRIRRKSLW